MNDSKSVTAAFIEVYGDVDGDTAVGLGDAILALQIATHMARPTGSIIHPAADVNRDGKIGLPEVMYILQKTAGVRQ